MNILDYGRSVVTREKLTIPHPRIAQRRFVLEPMAELAPDFRDPVSRRTIKELLAAAPEQAVRKAAVEVRLA